MPDYLDIIKPVVRAIKPYSLKDRIYKIKLNQNENPYDLPEWFKKEIMAEFSASSWNRYPTYTNVRLKEKLASHLNTIEDRLLIGNGSNELLQMLISLVLPHKSKVLIVTPTFLIYQQLAQLSEAEIHEIEFAQDWSFPVEKIVALLKGKPIQLCILCSPNSPTGASLSQSSLIQILEATRGLVLLDEAYHEFSDNRYVELQESFANLLISRTFSKALGLAGLRIGYFLGDSALIQEIGKAKLPYNLNIFSEFVAGKVMDRPDLIEENVDRILKGKQALFSELQKIDHLTVFPSAANFIMVETPLPSFEIFSKLAEDGILIRDISGYHSRLKNKLRITVGTPEENAKLVEKLHTVLREMNFK